ncbi:hypothetical protein VP01_91g7 [Puccinia sorghi]|uniref:Uncharacterized protein n=1 Tax=Puccinia sorghi TaxID=27349 RepID=A0A0L6U9F9_9BASI|nr:hypothetical protein VP01_91g7 [Puccinia sorghi]
MPSDFATQIGVTRLPNLTGDGRDGFPSRAQHDWCVGQYLGEMCEKKRGKALIDKNLYDRILAVCFDDSNKKTETAQFRWWVRRTFKLYSEPHGHYLMHENRPIAVKEQIYDILVYAHAECGHGGRDKTSAAVRRYFSWIPKDVVSRFVSVCPGCHARTQKDDEYFSNKGVDGYYPVHDKVRQMSIDSKRTSVDDYKNTSPYQPLLASGMVKILKAVEGARSCIPLPDKTSLDVHSAANHESSNYIIPVTSAHPAHLSSGSGCPSPLRPILSPANFTSSSGLDAAPTDIYGENYLPVHLGMNFGSSYLKSLGVPMYANQQPRSLSLPVVGFNEECSSVGHEVMQPLTHDSPERLVGRVINARSKSQCSPYHHMAKPPRPSTGRKLSSKSKEYKKKMVATPTEMYSSNAYYGSHSSTQSRSNSEDDGNSKSSTFSSSPPTYQSNLQPHQDHFHDYSFSQNSSLDLDSLPSLDLQAQVGPFGEYISECSNVDFTVFGGLPPSHLSYIDQCQGDMPLAGGMQMPESWHGGSEAVCDYHVLPELLNGQNNNSFDGSPTEFCQLASLQTPGGMADQLGLEAQDQGNFPAPESWASESLSTELCTLPDPSAYPTLYLPISPDNVELFLCNQSASSDIDSYHQHQDLVYSNHDSFNSSSVTIDEQSSFPSNSLGINFYDEFQFGPNPIY